MKARKGTGGFKVPEGYFGKLSQRLQDDSVKAGQPVWPEEAGFQMPEGYLESFETRLRARMEAQTGKVRRLRFAHVGWAVAAAAAITIILVLRPSAQEAPAAFEDLASNEISLYLETGFEELNAYELAEVLPMDEIAMEDVLESLPEEEHILDYLDGEVERYEDYDLENDE